MYFRVDLKMKKPTFMLLFYIELNFTVAFLLIIRKTWDDRFSGKVGGWGILRNGGGILVMAGIILKGGGDGVYTPLRTMY